MRGVVGNEQGFSLVELMMALVLLLVGILAMVAGLLPGQRLTTTSETVAVEANVAEQELQRIVSLGYSNIGLSAAPSPSADPNHPNYYVQATAPPTFQWDRTNPANAGTLCTPSTSCTGSLSPGPVAWTAGGMSGNLYRYVTWVDDPCDPTASPARCPTAVDYKMVVVAAVHNGSGYPKKPYLVSTIVADPTAIGIG